MQLGKQHFSRTNCGRSDFISKNGGSVGAESPNRQELPERGEGGAEGGWDEEPLQVCESESCHCCEFCIFSLKRRVMSIRREEEKLFAKCEQRGEIDLTLTGICENSLVRSKVCSQHFTTSYLEIYTSKTKNKSLLICKDAAILLSDGIFVILNVNFTRDASVALTIASDTKQTVSMADCW